MFYSILFKNVYKPFSNYVIIFADSFLNEYVDLVLYSLAKYVYIFLNCKCFTVECNFSLASGLSAPIFTISPAGPIKIDDTVTFNCSMDTQNDFEIIHFIHVRIGVYPNQTYEIDLNFNKRNDYYADGNPEIRVTAAPTGISFNYRVPYLFNQNAHCKVDSFYLETDMESIAQIELILWSA